MTDWRLPENRREAFQRSYSFSLEHKSFPGMVYSFLPGIAEAFDLDDEGKAWLVWLNGNTQNAVTSLLLLEASGGDPRNWRRAVDFWNEHFKKLEWDTDRRHQKSKFGEATEAWAHSGVGGAGQWMWMGELGWPATWNMAFSHPHMGRLSAWSMIEYARILFGAEVIPDSDSWMLDDKAGSRSHRNGIALVAGYDSVYWDADAADTLGIVGQLDTYADILLAEAEERNPGNPDVSRLTMESALCTYKGWHKPNRRYPNVYADMMYNRICKAEARFDRSLGLLWELRRQDLPRELRLEDNPYDPGLAPAKQNHYLETGQIPFLDGITITLDKPRKDPKWTL